MHEPVEDLSRSECDVALRLTAFEIINSKDQEGYHQIGLEGTGRFTLCPAEDDIFSAFGDPTEASVSAALGWFDVGSCPSSNSGGARKVSADQKSMLPPWLPANFIPDRVDGNLR